MLANYNWSLIFRNSRQPAPILSLMSAFPDIKGWLIVGQHIIAYITSPLHIETGYALIFELIYHLNGRIGPFSSAAPIGDFRASWVPKQGKRHANLKAL